MKLKYITRLICLLLFVAAVDTIPDPPAINPPGSHGSGISAPHCYGTSRSPEQDRFVACLTTGQIQITWFAFRLDRDKKLFGFRASALAHHATGLSPPIFS